MCPVVHECDGLIIQKWYCHEEYYTILFCLSQGAVVKMVEVSTTNRIDLTLKLTC
jgi:hypothetical protein